MVKAPPLVAGAAAIRIIPQVSGFGAENTFLMQELVTSGVLTPEEHEQECERILLKPFSFHH